MKDCRNKKFHSFEHRCVHDRRFTNMENFEEAVLSITLEYMKEKSQFHGLRNKS